MLLWYVLPFSLSSAATQFRAAPRKSSGIISLAVCLSQARKMASAACFYGLMALLLFLFVRMDHRRAAEDPAGSGSGSGDYP